MVIIPSAGWLAETTSRVQPQIGAGNLTADWRFRSAEQGNRQGDRI